MSVNINDKIKHVAIIMDGNGRWAQGRCRPRVWGHIRGSSIVSGIVEEADDLGLKALTLYAFSTENWSRPLGEVTTLFSLLRKFLLKERKKILKNRGISKMRTQKMFTTVREHIFPGPSEPVRGPSVNWRPR